jgi:SAM-dependent methyltransferase
MANDSKQKTADANGRLWGARARDWAEIQEAIVRPVYEAVVNRLSINASTAYLDIGCGAGMAAQMAAARGARVFGLDASENLLAIARSRVPNGEFRVGELETLPYPEDSFDIVTAFNSLQYAANPATATKQVQRVAKSGAQVVIVTWGAPEGMEWVSISAALRELLPPRPPDAPGMYALSEERALRAFAESAGLKSDEVFDVDAPVHYPSHDIAMRGLLSSGNAARAIELTSEERVREAYSKALERFAKPDGGYRIGARFRCLFARA